MCVRVCQNIMLSSRLSTETSTAFLKIAVKVESTGYYTHKLVTWFLITEYSGHVHVLLPCHKNVLGEDVVV